MGDLMKNYVEDERLMSQAREMFISSFKLQNGTLFTPLLLFYLQLWLISTKVRRFVDYTPKKYFNIFVQSALDARMQGDEISNSCRSRNNEALSQRLLQLPNHGTEPKHSN